MQDFFLKKECERTFWHTSAYGCIDRSISKSNCKHVCFYLNTVGEKKEKRSGNLESCNATPLLHHILTCSLLFSSLQISLLSLLFIYTCSIIRTPIYISLIPLCCCLCIFVQTFLFKLVVLNNINRYGECGQACACRPF